MKTMNLIIRQIELSECKLSDSDNNLKYIKALKSLNYWLTMFSQEADKIDILKSDYGYKYESYFCTGCGFSFYERVLNSILDYQYGNKPF